MSGSSERSSSASLEGVGNVIKARERLRFTSTFSTYITLLGYSMGISDIWRFPFLAYRNGGGAFLIPFLTMTIVCGIPIYFLEFSIGKFSGRGIYQIWDISPLLRGAGIVIPLFYLLYMVGTTIFRIWNLHFLINAFRNPLPWQHCNNEWNTVMCREFVTSASGIASENMTTNIRSSNMTFLAPNNTSTSASLVLVNSTNGKLMSSAEEYWEYETLHLSTGMTDLTPMLWKYILMMAAFRVLIFLGTWKSIKTIEKVMYVTTFLPITMTLAIFINSLTQPGAAEGIYYFFRPEFSKLLEPRIWIEATLMCFYTLAFGWGAIISLGSHADFKANSLRTAVIVPILDVCSAIFCGLVCFSVLGNMAHVYGVDVKDVINAGLSTGVVAYVTALTSLPLPQLWNVCFFIALFVTGLESQLIPLDMAAQVLGDVFRHVKQGSRIWVLVILSMLLFVCAIPTCTGAGGYIFLWMDWYGGAWSGTIIAFIEIILIAWVYGLDRLDEDTQLMIDRKMPAVMRLVLAFVSPLVVAVIFGMSCVKYVPPKYGSYVYPTFARAAGWSIVAAMMLPIPWVMIRLLRNTEGSLHQKISAYLHPVETWGPAEPEYEDQYSKLKLKYKQRRFKDLFYYNLFGSYPSDTAMHTVYCEELDHLKNTKC